MGRPKGSVPAEGSAVELRTAIWGKGLGLNGIRARYRSVEGSVGAVGAVIEVVKQVKSFS